MAYNKWTEGSFPRNYAGIHLIPDDQRLTRDGYTVTRFYSVMDSFVSKHLAGRILISSPGVYCARYFDNKPGVKEELYALKKVLQENELVITYARESTWSAPGEGTCPLIATR